MGDRCWADPPPDGSAIGWWDLMVTFLEVQPGETSNDRQTERHVMGICMPRDRVNRSIKGSITEGMVLIAI